MLKKIWAFILFLILVCAPVVSSVIILKYLWFSAQNWEAPKVNLKSKKSIHECIYGDDASTNKPPSASTLALVNLYCESTTTYFHHTFRNICDKDFFKKSRRQHFILPAKGFKRFEVNFVENSAKDCINPHFPIIHARTNAKHNAWLQVVYTDSKNLNLIQFVDTVSNTDNPIYPFYTLEDEFFDNPIWNHKLFEKPVGTWVARLYAVNVDHKRKTIKCMGGFSWGFFLRDLRFKPDGVFPKHLNPYNWGEDWKYVFIEVLPEYKNLGF